MLSSVLAIAPFKKRCQDVIGQATAEMLEKLHSLNFSVEPLDRQGIPVKRMKVETSVTYVSAIAHQWAPVLQQNPAEIAAAVIQQANDDQRSETFYPMTLSAEGPGWIWISIPDSEVVAWLQQMLTTIQRQPFIQSQHTGQGTNRAKGLGKDTWSIWQNINSGLPYQGQETMLRSQYAHARCCAWLRLANHAGLSPEQITVVENDSLIEMPSSGGQTPGIGHENPAMPSVTVPLVMELIDVIDEMNDWLTALDDRSTPAFPGYLQPGYPQEMQLEIQGKALKMGHQLGDAALALQANLPLMGVIRKGDRSYAEFPTALMLVTKSVLGCLLQDWLCSQAPDFL